MINTSILGDDEEKSKDLFNVVAQIEFINRTEAHIAEAYTIYQDAAHEMKDEWNEKLLVLQRLQGNLHAMVNGDSEHRLFEFQRSVNEIVSAWTAEYPNGSPVLDSQEKMIQPIINLVNTTLSTIRDEAIVHDIGLTTNEMNIVCRSWIAHVDGNAVVFNNIAKNLWASYQKLSETSVRVKSRKLKRACNIR